MGSGRGQAGLRFLEIRPYEHQDRPRHYFRSRISHQPKPKPEAAKVSWPK
jgi:hypothetical protein